jgi:hypothetical protein
MSFARPRQAGGVPAGKGYARFAPMRSRSSTANAAA